MGVQAFGELRRRDVKVTVLTNSLAANDEPLVHTGYARYRVALLRTGVDLYELSPTRIQRNRRLGFPGASLGRLHAKLAVVDRSVVFIGSMNLDRARRARTPNWGSSSKARNSQRRFCASSTSASCRAPIGCGSARTAKASSG